MSNKETVFTSFVGKERLGLGVVRLIIALNFLNSKLQHTWAVRGGIRQVQHFVGQASSL
jgi:hypothetical protein